MRHDICAQVSHFEKATQAGRRVSRAGLHGQAATALRLTKSVPVFHGVQKSINHCASVLGVGVDHPQPSVQSFGFRVAPEVAEVLHRHKGFVEERPARAKSSA